MIPLLSLTRRRWLLPKDDVLGLSGLLRNRPCETLSCPEKELPTPDPHLYPAMDRAVDRTIAAIQTEERIGIFGDYDCDGITSSRILERAFLRRGIEPLVRMPHRLREGYGLSKEHAQIFRDAGVTLLLTVDTGITAREAITVAVENGIDVIVMDHHRLPAVLPPAYAILHPGLCPPFEPHPAAVGTAFAFVEALEQRAGRGIWNGVDEDLALAMIGTVADLVPLQGWNRALVQAGLAALGRLQNGPLWELARTVHVHAALTSRDIAFRVAPQLNAAGRMDDPMIALQALRGDAVSLAAIHTLNQERQISTRSLTEEAQKRIERNEDRPFLCLASERYSPGIIGLIAGRLTEAYGKPSLVAATENGVCRASLRGIAGYDLLEGLSAVRDLLHSFGGHTQAAGCTFALEHLPAIESRLCAHLAAFVQPDALVPSLRIDAVLDPREVTLAAFAELEKLEPYGQGNPEPRFLICSRLLERARHVGEDGSHLQAFIGGVPAIGFRLGEFCTHTVGPFDIACRIIRETWNGRTFVKFVIDDLRLPAIIPAPVYPPS